VFAGAAREAVFSNPEVVRRVGRDFVAVALKAALVNNPPSSEEGLLYREIGRSKIAPQGICVVNSAGKVLDWVLMFDDDKSVLAFLDHAKKRYAACSDAKRPVPAERFMKYPSNKLDAIEDTDKAILVPARHAKGTGCPGKPVMPRGTVVVSVFGRRLGKDGKPVPDTTRQEDYVEDRFHVAVEQQRALVRTVAKAGRRRFRIADSLGRLLVSHAYLGQLDVNPVAPAGGKGRLEKCEFWGQRIEGGEKDLWKLRIDGKSAARGASSGGEGDRRSWDHEVKLDWEGLIELKAGHVTRLLLLAHGSEKLCWGNEGGVFEKVSDVARLPAGRAINLASNVRYGFLGQPIPIDEATDAPAREVIPGTSAISGEKHRGFLQAFGPSFLVFQRRVQEELNLSKAQQRKIKERLDDVMPDTVRVFKSLEELKPQERERKLGTYRQKVQEQLARFLRETLDARQLGRLRQIELQQHGLFALGMPDVQQGLMITDDQRQRFVEVVSAMDQQIRPLVEEAHLRGKPESIFPKILKLRKAHEDKIEPILTAAQKKLWKEMLGRPFDVRD
jgi:hypothetical protein